MTRVPGHEYDHTDGAYIGTLYRKGGQLWAEDRDVVKRRFPSEEEAVAWLEARWSLKRERARATLGPAWAATVDARALGDAA